MIEAPPPVYPVAARRRREQGTVVLLVRLSASGRPETVSVERSSGHEALDRAALGAVRRWRWSPAPHDGDETTVVGIVRIPFVLRD